jgi:threonine-phosphate decarboxylase
MDEEKLFMEKEFKKIGIRYLPSSANYYLLQIAHAHEVVRALEEKGILVRDCSNFIGLDKTYIRVAVRSRKENSRLIREIARLCRG